jgi:hypothetical protein
MTEDDEKEIQERLQEAFPPVTPQLRRDLWPAMLRKLDAPTLAPPWYDWALIGGSAGMLALFPKLILLFAYHF